LIVFLYNKIIASKYNEGSKLDYWNQWIWKKQIWYNCYNATRPQSFFGGL